jgi:predicted 3-demethylubiquinone-9 3-methyltransferase (glyoxalase superfamily)
VSRIDRPLRALKTKHGIGAAQWLRSWPGPARHSRTSGKKGLTMPTASKIVPCIWLDDQAEEAAAFYTGILPDGRITATSCYPESGANPSGKPPGSVLTVEFEVAGQRFTVLNGGPLFAPNQSLSFFLRVDSAAEADKLYAALIEGGEALMPLGSYPWSERYGWVKDRFGVSWQVIAGSRPPGGAAIAPCMMFSGGQQGRAEEALRFYASVFADGLIESVERYLPGEGPVDSVKHGRVMLAGQELIAMDSHVTHGITFNEGLSLQVMCKDQDELDHYWDALGDGGEHGPCGWLKDRFGFSWQIAPANIDQWMASKDSAAKDRAFRAMLGMKKLDLAALQKAFEGR